MRKSLNSAQMSGFVMRSVSLNFRGLRREMVDTICS
jgi:hypothetical protein